MKFSKSYNPNRKKHYKHSNSIVSYDGEIEFYAMLARAKTDTEKINLINAYNSLKYPIRKGF